MHHVPIEQHECHNREAGRQSEDRQDGRDVGWCRQDEGHEQRTHCQRSRDPVS